MHSLTVTRAFLCDFGSVFSAEKPLRSDVIFQASCFFPSMPSWGVFLKGTLTPWFIWCGRICAFGNFYFSLFAEAFLSSFFAQALDVVRGLH